MVRRMPARRPERRSADPARAAWPRPARRPVRSWHGLRWALILLIWLALAGIGTILWFARDLPRPASALDAPRRPGIVLLDRRGNSLANFGDVVGEPLRLSELPPALPAAAVAIEDRRFWWHPGIDPVGVGRALWVNLTSHRLQGGSTITQQVAKTLFLSNTRTIKRKVQELMLTLWLERHFTKREILEIWLNRIYLGGGAWGVDAAAHLYFGVSARALSLPQAAVLAGLAQAPSRLNPRVDPDAAAARGREVLVAMAETGAITPAQETDAAARIRFPPAPGGGWYAGWAAIAASELLPPNTDARLRTAFDPRVQALAQSRLDAILAGPGRTDGAGQGAVVVMDAASGAVSALVGGRGEAAGGFDRAVAARRQPGSAFKPFVWLAALEHGLTPDDPVETGPVRVSGWSPANHDDGPRAAMGTVTIETALAQSVNTAAVRLLEAAGGPRPVIAVARRLGIADPLPETPSLALGTGEVGLLELTAAYAPFFNGGTSVSPHAIEAAQIDGREIAPVRPPPRRVIDPDRARAMARMLGAVVARGTGRAAAVPGRTVAGKTGTTQDNRDAWFVGAVDGTLIGVWIGNDDDRPMRGVTGGSLPARLFHDIAAQLR